MAGGLPILTSASGDLRTIIQEEGIGQYFDPGDSETLADLLSELLLSPSVLNEMSERVRRIYPERFDAEIIYGNYSDYLEELVAGIPSDQPSP